MNSGLDLQIVVAFREILLRIPFQSTQKILEREPSSRKGKGMEPVRYYVPEDGDDVRHPNVFLMPVNGVEIRVRATASEI